MGESNIKQKTFSGFFWRFAERCGAQGVNFMVSIILARLLLPKDYGIVALATVFISVLQVFVDGGLGNALIQKLDADDTDFSTVFYFNIIMCSIIYAGMFSAAPFIADFYGNKLITSVVRVLSLTIIISAINNVQQAYVSRNLLFKRFFFSTIGGTIGSAVLGIAMAYMGFGVWALVVQQLTNLFVDTLILWITVKWRPKKVFSIARLKTLYTYGWKLLVSGLIDTVYNNIEQLIIGKLYSASDLAYYNKGRQFPNLAIININTSIDSVLFPAISASQENKDKVKQITRRSIQISSYVVWPIMVGMMVCARPLVSIILTDKWLDSVVYLQIFCIAYAFYPVHTSNLNAIKAIGRSDVFLKLEIIKKIIGLTGILIAVPLGVKVIAITYVIISIISAFVNAAPIRILLGYIYREQIRDMLPAIILSLIMGGCCTSIMLLKLSNIVTLIIQVVVGVLVYMGISKLLKIDSFEYLISFLKEFISR